MKLSPLPGEALAAYLYTSLFFLQTRMPFDPDLWADFSSMPSQTAEFLALLLLFQVIKRNQMYWHNTSSSIADYFSSEQKYFYLNKGHYLFFFFLSLQRKEQFYIIMLSIRASKRFQFSSHIDFFFFLKDVSGSICLIFFFEVKW